MTIDTDQDVETDPLWSELFAQAAAEISLPENFEVLIKPDAALDNGRWYYQIKCLRPDTFTGKLEYGYSGKSYLSPHAVLGELVQTVWGLYQGYLMHEARESFLWRGRRIFGPHIDLEALWVASETTTYREDPR